MAFTPKAPIGSLFNYNDSRKEEFIKTQPNTLIAFLFGVAPIKFHRGHYEFSRGRIAYGFVLISLVAIARLSLERFGEQPTFYNSVMHASNVILPASCVLSMFWLMLFGQKFFNVLDQEVQLMVLVSKSVMLRIQAIKFVIFGFTFILLIMSIVLQYLYQVKFQITLLTIDLLDLHLLMSMCILQTIFVAGTLFAREYVKICQNAILSLTPSSIYTVDVLPSAVNEVIDVYEKILDAIQNLNECAGISLGVASLMTALHGIAFTYALVVNPIGTLEIGLTVKTAIFLFYEWVKLTAAELFMQQVTDTSKIVYKVWRKKHSKETQEQLQTFLTYSIHRRVNLTICGLIPLNYSLMLTMAGSITTYMIILVQFQQTLQFSDGTVTDTGNETTIEYDF